MIRIAISQAAFDAIAKTLPLGEVGYENATNEKGERLIWLDRAVVDRLRAMRRPGESFDYEFAEPPLLHRERLDGGQQLGLSPITLNLINPHVGDARLPESERHGGLRRNVDHSATDERSPANDRDHHATAVVEVDDADLRPHRQAAMRRNQSSETRIPKI
jgi:hypothetical protein